MVKFLLHRPIATIMSTLGLFILGIVAFNYIPVSLMPDIDIPEITVQVTAEDMSARQIEDAIVKKIRGNLKQVSHIDDIKSESSNGLGVIRLTFKQGTNIDYSFIEVNEKIDRAMGNLPKSVERPKIIKASVTDVPVFYLNMNLKEQSTNTLNGTKEKKESSISQEFTDFSRFVNQVIRKRIEQVDEVAMVDVSGLTSSEILIIPNHKKLNILGININDLESAIKKYELEVSNLLIKDGQYQYNIRLGSTLNDINEIKNIFINNNNKLFQLKEIAEVLERPKERIGLVLSDGKEAVTMAIIKQSDARIEDLKTALNKLINRLSKEYDTISFSITRDQTKLLDYAISNIKQSLLWGMLLAFGVMFLFLKNVKAPLLIGISIPVSITISLLFFYLLNISINIISLSGLVLGIGLMIDNSIIVIDNITQFRDQKYSLNESCILGTNEVVKPLLSSALTTCAVFLPLIFLSGIAGSLFFDQAMAITISLFVSLLVAVSLLPVMYKLFHLKDVKDKGRVNSFLKKTNRLNYASIYKKGFRFVMRKQGLSWIISLFLLFGAVGLFTILPKEQIPNLTQTEVLLNIDWNEQINVEENKRRVLELLAPVKQNLVNHTAFIGSQQFLLDKEGKSRASESIIYLKGKSPETINKIKKILYTFIGEKYSNVSIEYKEVDNIFNLIFSNKEAPLNARIRNVNDIGGAQSEQLKKVWYQIQQDLNGYKMKPIQWQEHISILVNQEKLIAYGINSNEIYNALKTAFSAQEVTTIINNQNFVPVIIGNNSKNIRKILNETTVQSNDSTSFYIKEFIKETRSENLKTITGGIEGEYYPIELDISSENIDNTINTINETVNTNKWYNVSFTGAVFSNQKLVQELKIILLISLILLYFILASQFESFVLPLIILLEVPIDLAGAFLFLKLFGMSINLMSMIGIVVMSGIIINDSILKIDSIIQLEKQGYSLMKAILVAGQKRLKPIIMTSLTTILALIPLLFSSGIGVELQVPLAIALIGGMLLGTLVSLYFIPLCYYYFARKFDKGIIRN